MNMARKLKPKRAKLVKFIENEPPKAIAGGPTRESSRIRDDKYPEIRKRRRVNAALLNHCPDAVGSIDLRPDDVDMLRRIARETIATGTHPIIRRRAIQALQRYPSVKTLNVLTDLAALGEDEYVRSDALRSLGGTGVAIAAPLLLRGLEDRSPLVREVSALGLRDLAMKADLSSFWPYLSGIKNAKKRAQIEALLRGEGVPQRSEKNRVARADTAVPKGY